MGEDFSAHKGKYLHDKKITEAFESEQKTPNGLPIVEVKTEDSKVRLIPAKVIGRLVSNKPVDATAFRDMRVKPVCEDIMDVLGENDIYLSDWDYINAIINGSMKESYKTANDVLWKTDAKTFLDVDRVLKAQRITLKDILEPDK